jgi:hypothetical protein
MTREELREEWRGRLDHFVESGLSQRQWCAENGVPLHRLAYWRGQLRQQGTTNPKHIPGWCPIDVVSGQCNSDSGVTIRVGAAAIGVRSGFDAGVLRAVVHALGDAPC